MKFFLFAMFSSSSSSSSSSCCLSEWIFVIKGALVSALDKGQFWHFRRVFAKSLTAPFDEMLGLVQKLLYFLCNL